MSEASLEWLNRIADFENPFPYPPRPFVRTKNLNDQRDGCFVCGYRRVTRHHIRKGREPLVVHLCWKHHQIMHGTALDKYTTEDIFATLMVAREHKIFKELEAQLVEKVLIQELTRRKFAEDAEAFFSFDE